MVSAELRNGLHSTPLWYIYHWIVEWLGIDLYPGFEHDNVRCHELILESRTEIATLTNSLLHFSSNTRHGLYLGVDALVDFEIGAEHISHEGCILEDLIWISHQL